MTSFRLIISLLCGLVMAACTPTVPNDDGALRYARWLTLTDSTATVLNPWRPGEVLHRYTLEPCRRAVSATSLHAYLAHRLGALDRIVGVMDADYIVAPELRAALDTESATPAATPAATVDGGTAIADMGSSQSPNLERIKTAGADLIFASPFENVGYGALETLGIPIVECADYMEATPLGRAEWMRFYGRLLGRAEQADSLYAAEEAAYSALCSLRRVAEPRSNLSSKTAAAAGSKATVPAASPAGSPTAAPPSLLLGKRGGQAWYVPGGRSYLGALLHDADAVYVFADEASTGSVPLDFETVYSRAKDADLWLITYAAPPAADGTFAPMTYADLAAEDERYVHFRPFREHRVWACNTLAVPYYDALPWAPSTLLREIIAIVHPDRLPDYKPQYFQPLQ